MCGWVGEGIGGFLGLNEGLLRPAAVDLNGVRELWVTGLWGWMGWGGGFSGIRKS